MKKGRVSKEQERQDDVPRIGIREKRCGFSQGRRAAKHCSALRGNGEADCHGPRAALAMTSDSTAGCGFAQGGRGTQVAAPGDRKGRPYGGVDGGWMRTGRVTTPLSRRLRGIAARGQSRAPAPTAGTSAGFADGGTPPSVTAFAGDAPRHSPCRGGKITRDLFRISICRPWRQAFGPEPPESCRGGPS